MQILLPYVLLYKYWALFIATFLGSLAVPIPAGTLLVASAALASQGYFSIYTVILVVIVANILGDTISYWVARQYGERLLVRIPFFKKILHSKNFILISDRIKERPGFIIFISRFEVIATLSVNLICGLGKVPYRKFLLYEAIGAFFDAVVYGMIGFLFGDTWQTVNNLVGNFSLVVFVVVAACMILFWKKIMHRLSIQSAINAL